MAEDETEAESEEAQSDADKNADDSGGTDGSGGTNDAGGKNDAGGTGGGTHDSALLNVPVEISAVLGTALMPVSQLLKVGRGAVLELDRQVGDPIDIYVNNRLVAQGEVAVIEDRLGVTLTENLRAEDIIPSGDS